MVRHQSWIVLFGVVSTCYPQQLLTPGNSTNVYRFDALAGDKIYVDLLTKGSSAIAACCSALIPVVRTANPSANRITPTQSRSTAIVPDQLATRIDIPTISAPAVKP